MNRNTAKVVGDALALPPRSRARLADKLLESLDQPRQKAIDKLWADEVEDRIDAYEKGEIKVISGKVVFRELRSKKRRAADSGAPGSRALPTPPRP
jgi:putative addiction module component (TIGR02574 family)